MVLYFYGYGGCSKHTSKHKLRSSDRRRSRLVYEWVLDGLWIVTLLTEKKEFFIKKFRDSRCLQDCGSAQHEALRGSITITIVLDGLWIVTFPTTPYFPSKTSLVHQVSPSLLSTLSDKRGRVHSDPLQSLLYSVARAVLPQKPRPLLPFL